MGRFLNLRCSAVILLLSIVCLLPVMADAAQYVPEPTNRVRKSFNRDWKFIYFQSSTENTAPANPLYDDSTWADVTVPHTWSSYEHTGDHNPYRMRQPVDRSCSRGGDLTWIEGWGWYRKRFEVPSEYSTRRVFVEFEGVSKYSKVWVNDNYIGEHLGGFTQFSWDITPYVVFGSTNNIICVEAHDDLWRNSIPPGSAGNWDTYGGIYRDCYLIITDQLHVPFQGKAGGASINNEGGTFVKVDEVSLIAGNPTVQVLTYVKNDSGSGKTCTVKTEIVDRFNVVVASRTSNPTAVGIGAIVEFDQTSDPIPNPELWDYDTVYGEKTKMYKVYTTVYDGATPVDDFESPLGFRWFSFTKGNPVINDNRPWLNGSERYSRGNSRHQDFYWLCDAVPDWMARRDYIDQKRLMDMNFTRTAHYPQDPSVYHVTDELGIACIVEVPCIKGNAQTCTAVAVRNSMVQEMIRAYRNHPSVFYWSMGNETDYEVDDAIARAIDDTRPIYCNKCTGGNCNADLTNADFECETHVNCTVKGRWAGWRSPASNQDCGDELHQLEKVQGPPDAPKDVCMKKSAITWMYHDGSAVRMYDFCPFGRTQNPKGFVDGWRNPKYVYYSWQAWWADAPMVFIRSHPWVPAELGLAKEICVHSNCDQVELFVGSTSHGVQFPNDYNEFKWPGITVTSDILKAEGWHPAHGVYVSTAVYMSGAPAKFELKFEDRWIDPDDTSNPAEIIADRAGLVYIKATIVDSNNVHVLDATNDIIWSISGPGTLCAPSLYESGFENNASGGGADWVYAGEGYNKTPVGMLIRSTNVPGTITVTATSTNLDEASIQIISKPADVTTPTHIVSTADPTSLYADGGSVSEITATIKDDGEFTVTTATNPITFSITGPGSLVGTTIIAPTDGIATINLQSTFITGTVTVTATADGLDEETVEIITLAPPVATTLFNTADTLSILADGLTTSLVTCTILDQHGAPMTNKTNTITFSITGEGSLIAPTSSPASSGIATVQLQSTTTAGTATVTATSNTIAQGTVEVTITPGPVVKLVNTAQPLSIDANGVSVSTITARVCDTNSNPVTTVNESAGPGFSGRPGWNYRKTITISNTSGSALSDFQVDVLFTAIDTVGLIDNNKMESDYADVRFADSGDNEIYFWRTSDRFWVKVPSILTSPDTTIYIYYGNSGASASSYHDYDNAMQKLAVDANTVALWHMDEGVGNPQDAGGTNHGTNNGSTWAGSDGGNFDSASPVQSFGTGSAMNFTGTSSVSAGTAGLSASQGTVESWFNSSATTGNQKIYCHRETLDTRIYLMVYNGNLAVRVGGIAAHSGATALNTGTWYHSALTWNNGNYEFYLNGLSEGSGTYVNFAAINATQYLGAYQGTGDYYSGILDEVRILNRVLSVEELRADYERRQYVSVEPTEIVGTEEEGGGGVAFSLTGEGSLLGTTLVDIVDGVSTILLQSTALPGMVTVTATADGLDEGTINVNTVSAGEPAKILSTASPLAIDADGSSTSLITARVCDTDDFTVVSATNTITFSVTGGGTLLDTTSKPAAAGVATVMMQSATSAGTATVSATADGLEDGVVDVTLLPNPNPTKIINTADNLSIEADGSSTSLITATVHNDLDEAVTTATNTITFSLSGQGSLLDTTTKPASNGEATVQLQSTTTIGTVTVKATSGGLSEDTVEVTLSTMEADHLIVTATELSIIANGRTYSDIHAYFADSLERIVPITSTSTVVSFSLSGPGNLAPSRKDGDHEKARLTSTLELGTATVTATSSGLGTATAEVAMTIGDADRITVSVNPPVLVTSSKAISTFTVTAEVTDSGGHVIDSRSDELNLRILKKDVEYVNETGQAQNGVKLFNLELAQPGNYDIKVTASGLTEGTTTLAALLNHTVGGEMVITGALGQLSLNVPGNAFGENYIVDIYDIDEVTEDRRDEIAEANRKAMENTEIYFEQELVYDSLYEFRAAHASNIEISTAAVFFSSVTIKLPFDETNGIIDDTNNVSLENLGVYRLNEWEEAGGDGVGRHWWYKDELTGRDIYKYEFAEWIKQSGAKLDPSEQVMELLTNHFSVYCLMAEAGGGSIEITEVANYPNPFNPDDGSTTLMYSLNNHATDVKIGIYTVSGRLIRSLPQGTKNYGDRQEAYWDGKDEGTNIVSNGIYFFKVTATAGGVTTERTGKIVVMR